MPIRLLPVSLANQIAAGEVIERPASVVKELVENSLDAGASEITVEIEQGGRRRILVRDNGKGIAEDELGLALSRHATSKIASLADLEAISSLGFRGEALASISSVSRLQLTSRPADQESAWCAWAEGRDMQPQIAPASHPIGTSIDVQDLFFNTPARRKFLRTDKTEFGHIDELLKRLALARYDVRWVLRHQQREVRHYPAISEPAKRLERIAKICGASFAEQALPIAQTSGSVSLRGWIAAPVHCRHQSDVQYFYVNGRMMRDRLLSHAIRQAYGEHLQQLGGADRSPTYVLYLELPTADVDVNVHPAKHEVRFQQARQIHDFVLASLRQVLQQQPSESTPLHQYQPATAELQQQVAELKPAHGSPLPGAQAQVTAKQVQAQTDAFRQMAQTAPKQSVTQGSAAPAEPAAVLAVVQSVWALVQHEQQLLLVDLQRVQQQVQARQFEVQYQTGLAGQPLLIPVQLKKPEHIALCKQADSQQLAQLGILLQPQRQSIIIEQVPAALRQSDISQTLPPLIELLNELEGEVIPERFWLQLAAHQVASDYSREQANYWVEQWQQRLHGAREFTQVLPLPQLPERLR